jgi:hypothetical protein
VALGWCLAHPGAGLAAAPDWSGFYRMAGGFDEDTKLPGFKPINGDLDPVVMAHLQPWARAKMEATDTEADDTGSVCQLVGVFRHPTTVAGFRWLQRSGEVLMVSTAIQEVGVRRVYMTDHHPKNLPLTWDGHSIGHWEGDTLVVDTIGFNDKSWLMSGMEPHSEELHMVERIRSVDNGGALEVMTTVDDRQALTSAYSYSRYYKKVDAEYVEDVCNGEPGEPQRWNAKRKAAIAKQLARRSGPPVGAPAAASK